MRSILLLAITSFILSSNSYGQDHGSVTYKGQTIQLTGYRTRTNNDKRWVIAEGKKDGKLYSVTVTLRPDVTQTGNITTDAKHSLTLTISNADYSGAENVCFDGGSQMMVTPQNSKYSVTGKDMKQGNCFGKSSGTEKLSFVMKP